MTSDKQNLKFKIVTLGCRTNQYESQGYSDQLLSLGYQKAEEQEPADICIVNTCTVTESADSSSRHAIRNLARNNPSSQLVVTGCFAEAKPDLVRQMEGVNLVVPNREKESLVKTLLPQEDVPELSIKNFEAHTRAFVKVQDGCNSYCTYCIIPYVRGRSRSRRKEEIIREVEELIASGFQEIVITGINVGDFDGNPAEGEAPYRLADLVRTLDAIPGLKRLRLSSIDPDEVDDDLTSAILQGKNTCPSMHIVLQSGSNVILKRMNRKYTRQVFMQTIDRLRGLNPDFTFTTDVIVGFPGETEADFNDTLAIMRDVRFAHVHMFPYSDRPRTRSALMPGKIAPEVIKKRKSEILTLAEETAFSLRQDYIGRTMSVLTENIDSAHPEYISGRTHNFLPIQLPRGLFSPNQILEVKVSENSPQGLVGHVY